MFEYTFKRVEKHLRYGYISASGRNFTGIICVHHQGGGHKRRGYRIDFFRRLNSFGFVSKIKQIAFFSGLIGLIIYQNGIASYILLADKMDIGDRIFSGSIIDSEKKNEFLVIGSALSLLNVPVFTRISNVEYLPFGGGKLARAAGTSGILVSQVSLNKFLVKFKSG